MSLLSSHNPVFSDPSLLYGLIRALRNTQLSISPQLVDELRFIPERKRGELVAGELHENLRIIALTKGETVHRGALTQLDDTILNVRAGVNDAEDQLIL